MVSDHLFGILKVFLYTKSKVLLGQKPSIEKGQTTNYKITNNDQHQSSPKSTLSVIGA
jgi:hypothetical protein